MIKLKSLLLEIGEGNYHYNIKRESTVLNSIKAINGDTITSPKEKFTAPFVSDSGEEYNIVLLIDGEQNNYNVEVVFESRSKNSDQKQQSAVEQVQDTVNGLVQDKILLCIPSWRGTSYASFAKKRKLKPESELSDSEKNQLLARPSIFSEYLYDFKNISKIKSLVKPLKSISIMKSEGVLHNTSVPYAWILVRKNQYDSLIVDLSDPQAKEIIKTTADQLAPVTVNLMSTNKVVNKGEALKVVSTVVYFVKKVSEILPIKSVTFNPAKRSEEGDKPLDQTGRGRLYLAFVKRQYPDAKIEINQDNITVKLKQ